MRKVRGTQFHQFGEAFDRDFLRKVFGHVILDLAELVNRQPAAIDRRLPSRARVFLDEVRGEELGERGDTRRLARHARGQKLRARQADGPKDFVTAKKISHLYAVGLSGITGFERGQERLDGDMKRKIVEFFTGRGWEIDFVRRARSRDEKVARTDFPSDPCTANVAFPEFRRAPERAGNVWLWCGRHEKTIHHARMPPAPSIKSRPLEPHTISHHLAGEIPGKGGGRAAVGRGHLLCRHGNGSLAELCQKLNDCYSGFVTGYDKAERYRKAAVLALRFHAEAAQPGQQRPTLPRAIA